MSGFDSNPFADPEAANPFAVSGNKCLLLLSVVVRLRVMASLSSQGHSLFCPF